MRRLLVRRPSIQGQRQAGGRTGSRKEPDEEDFVPMPPLKITSSYTKRPPRLRVPIREILESALGKHGVAVGQ